MELLKNDARVLNEPACKVSVKKLADSAIIFAVRPWTKPKDYSPVTYDFLENIKYAFDEAGIDIPYPSLTVHVAKD